jgi:hypothetical protein
MGPVPADPSSSEEASIAEALTGVRDEVRSHPPSQGLSAEEARGRRLAARDQAELHWAVTAERPFLRAPGAAGRVRAAAAAPLKRVIRRLVRWYMEPALEEQRRFNAAILQLVDDLAERTAALEDRRDRGDRRA